MNNKLKVFDNPAFGSVRVIEINDTPWFVGKDVAEILGYSDPQKSIKMHVDDEDKLTRQIVVSGQSRNVYVINESGLYSLILSSKLPAAKQFKRWVTTEVLPAIHKHGAYMTPEVIEQTLLNPEYIIKLATTLKDAQAENKALTKQVYAQNQQIDAQTQQIAELEPKGAYYDIVLQTPNTMTTTQIAKDYAIETQVFNRVLHDIGIIYPQNRSWVLYQQHANKGYGKTNTFTYWNGDRENSSLALVWTQSGRLFLYEQLKSHNILPEVETGYSHANDSNPIVIKCRAECSENNSKFKGISHDLMERAYKAYKEKTSPLKVIVKELGISSTTFYKKADKFERFPNLRVY